MPIFWGKHASSLQYFYYSQAFFVLPFVGESPSELCNQLPVYTADFSSLGGGVGRNTLFLAAGATSLVQALWSNAQKFRKLVFFPQSNFFGGGEKESMCRSKAVSCSFALGDTTSVHCVLLVMVIFCCIRAWVGLKLGDRIQSIQGPWFSPQTKTKTTPSPKDNSFVSWILVSLGNKQSSSFFRESGCQDNFEQEELAMV